MAERVYIEHLQILKTCGIPQTNVTTPVFSLESLGVASKFRGALYYRRLEMAREHKNPSEREHTTDEICDGAGLGQCHLQGSREGKLVIPERRLIFCRDVEVQPGFDSRYVERINVGEPGRPAAGGLPVATGLLAQVRLLPNRRRRCQNY